MFENIKLYLYGALLAVFVGMAGTIWHLSGKVDELNGQLATANQQLNTSKDLIAKMTGSEKITEQVDNYITQGQDFVAGEHDKVEEELRQAYQDYLIKNKQDELCSTTCATYVADGPSCPLPQPPKEPNKKEDDIIKKKMIEAAWKNFCIANRMAEGCQ